MPNNLYQLNKNLKALYLSFLIVLSIGVGMGMIYIYLTTSMTIDGTETRYAGDNIPDNFDPDIDVLENSPKGFLELVSHAHNHIVSFSFIIAIELSFIRASIVFLAFIELLLVSAS